jgi:hypothetical protein
MAVECKQCGGALKPYFGERETCTSCRLARHWRFILPALIGSVGVSCLGIGIWIGARRGEWKPTGDGKTVVHTRTGEMRLTANGLTVQEVAANREAANRLAKMEYDRSAAAAKIEADRKTAEWQQNEYERRQRNEKLLPKIARAVSEGNAQVLSSRWGERWRLNSQLIRQGKFPTKSERDALVNLLDEFESDALVRKAGTPSFGEPFISLKKDLAALEYFW